MSEPAAKKPTSPPLLDRNSNQSRTPWAGNIVRGIFTQYHHLPTGIQPLVGLPMPPFTSKDEHKVFLDSLRFHVAALGGLDGAVPVSILNGMFSSVNLERKTLSELELQVCFQSFFPAPWELHDLADLLNDHRKSFRPTDEGGWRWLFDPEFEAKPDPEGGWLLLRHERGSFEEDKLDAEYDLCLFWMAMMSDRRWGTNKYELAEAKFLAPEAAARIRDTTSSRFTVAGALAEPAVAAPTGWFKKLFVR